MFIVFNKIQELNVTVADTEAMLKSANEREIMLCEDMSDHIHTYIASTYILYIHTYIHTYVNHALKYTYIYNTYILKVIRLSASMS